MHVRVLRAGFFGQFSDSLSLCSCCHGHQRQGIPHRNQGRIECRQNLQGNQGQRRVLQSLLLGRRQARETNLLQPGGGQDRREAKGESSVRRSVHRRSSTFKSAGSIRFHAGTRSALESKAKRLPRMRESLWRTSSSGRTRSCTATEQSRGPRP